MEEILTGGKGWETLRREGYETKRGGGKLRSIFTLHKDHGCEAPADGGGVHVSLVLHPSQVVNQKGHKSGMDISPWAHGHSKMRMKD